MKLNLIHSDLSGPFPVPSYGKSSYYITLIDDATRYSWVKFMQQKSETLKIIKDFIAEIELQYEQIPKRLRTHNGGEYDSNNLKE